ncbi:MAG TPA: hypothetical protein VN688_07530 [Gemmataceae bacterium]|nr:hypothetical protein [Gemmataceae bacterium]
MNHRISGERPLPVLMLVEGEVDDPRENFADSATGAAGDVLPGDDAGRVVQ